MSATSGRPDFFALEAGEYLQELGRALDGDGPPGPELARVARALRGASLLGGPADYTRLAAALEAAIRSLVDGHQAWEPGIAELLRGALESMTDLLRHTRTWGMDNARTALTLAATIEAQTRPAGTPPPPPFGRRSADRNQPGVRAFLAREAAIVAGAVERLARDPSGIENPAAIENVLRTTRPLRGVAFLSDVPPLGELLDLTEQLLRDPLSGVPPSPRSPAALSRLAASLAQAARALTESGAPAVDSPELATTARAARVAAMDESDVVSIEGLFHPDDPHPIVEPGTPPLQELPGPDAALPLMALAARLTQAADQFSEPAPSALRALQETALLLQLRAGLPPRPILPADRLVMAMVRALGRGAAAADTAQFVESTRRAAAALTALAGGGPETNVPGLTVVTESFETLPGTHEGALTDTGDEETTIVPIEALLLAPDAPGGEEPVVAIESLLLAPATHGGEEPVVAIESLAPDEGADAGAVPITSLLAATPDPAFDPLETSLATYQRLLQSVPETLLPASLSAPAPRAPAAPPATAPHPDPEIVPIEALLYRGRGALRRAGEVRQEIDAIVAAFRAERRLEPLIQELLDLVPLALDESA